MFAGELILDYTVYPYLNINNDYINSTGLFKTTYENQEQQNIL